MTSATDLANYAGLVVDRLDAVLKEMFDTLPPQEDLITEAQALAFIERMRPLVWSSFERGMAEALGDMAHHL